MESQRNQAEKPPKPAMESCRKKKLKDDASFLEDVNEHIDEFIHASMDEHKTCFQKTIKKMFGLSKAVAEKQAKEVESRLPLQTTVSELSRIGSSARRMALFRDSECYLLFYIIVFTFVVPCHCHESLFDGRTLYAGNELWRQSLPLQSGSRVYKLERLKSNAWYEVKISYPASIPALFSLQLLKNGVNILKLNQMRRLLNTGKLIFKTKTLEEVNNKEGLYVLVTVEPEGIVAVPNFKERSFIIYNIGKFYNIESCNLLLLKSGKLMITVCEELLLGIPYSTWPVVVLVVLCLVVSLILPRFLPSCLLIKDRAAESRYHRDR